MRKILAIGFLMLGLIPLVRAQSLFQSFEGGSQLDSSWSYTTWPEPYSWVNQDDDYWGITDDVDGDITAFDGTMVFGGTDLEGPATDFQPWLHTITFDAVNVAGLVGDSVIFQYYTDGLDEPNGDTAFYAVQYSRSETVAPGNWVALPPNSGAWTEVGVAIPPGTNWVRLFFAVRQNGGDAFAFDALRVKQFNYKDLRLVRSERQGANNLRLIFNQKLDASMLSDTSFALEDYLVTGAQLVAGGDSAIDLTLHRPMELPFEETLSYWGLQTMMAGTGVSFADTTEVLINDGMAPVLFSELMYNDFNISEDFQFIELFNNSAQAVNLSGYHLMFNYPAEQNHFKALTFGPHTMIEPYGTLLMTKTPSEMKPLYRIQDTVYDYRGELEEENPPMQLVLKNTAGMTIDSVAFDEDDNGWSPTRQTINITQYDIFSQQLDSIGLDNSLASSWDTAYTLKADTLVSPYILTYYCTPGVLGFPIAKKAMITQRNPLQVQVIFNRPMGNSALTTSNYTGIGSLSSAQFAAGGQDTVILDYTNPQPNGQKIMLTVDSQIADSTGHPLGQDFQFHFEPYNTDSAGLVLTEIMYKTHGGKFHQFVELYNNDTTAVELGGMHLRGEGGTFTFPSYSLDTGEVAYVAYDSVQAGNFFGATFLDGLFELSEMGDSLVLMNSEGTIIDSVPYMNNSPWPNLSSMRGPSIELTGVDSLNELGANWVASNNYVDTFGTTMDSVFATIDSIYTIVGNKEFIAEEGSDWTIYPNPATSNSMLFFNERVNVTVMDSKGRLILRQENTDHLRLSNFAPGMYLLRTDQHAVRKLIVR